MTEFEITHGLSQDAPGPLEPVELAKVPATPVAGGWLPIESAPKDGGYVLLRGKGDHRLADGYWLQEACNGVGAWIWPYVHSEPMHWMPLPAAPGAAPAAPVSTVAQGDAQDELATYSLQPLATAFFTEKGEVAYTGIYDRTLKALEAVKTTRMGISAGSIDLYARPHAPAAGDALDLTLAQKYEDACILANANARDAERWRSFRRAITQLDEEWLNHMDSALTAMGLDPDGDELPSDEQVDAAADAAIAAQRKGGA